MAQEPTCSYELTQPMGDRVAMAWVSPAGARAPGANANVTLFDAAELRTWIAAEGAELPRVLQGVGLRKPFTAPKRGYKVTIFEVEREDLCRPVDEEEGTAVAGLPACAKGTKGVAVKTNSCGNSLDLGTGEPGPAIYLAPWREAAESGFCVLPLERFLAAQ